MSLAVSFSTLTPLPRTFACASCCQAIFNADFGFFHGTDWFLSTKNERQRRAPFLPPASSLAWLGAPWALHLLIQVRSDTLAKRKKHALKIHILNRYVLAGNLLVPCTPVSSTRSRWSYKDMTDHALHFLPTDPTASQPGWCEGKWKPLPPHHAEHTNVVVHRAGTSGHSVAVPRKRHAAIN